MFHISWLGHVDEKPLESFSTLSEAIASYEEMLSFIACEAPQQVDKFCIIDDYGRVVYR